MQGEPKAIKQDINFLEYPLWFQNDRLPPDFTWNDRDGFVYRAPFKVPVRLDGLYLMYIMLTSQNQGWTQQVVLPQRQIMIACGVKPGKDHAIRLKESLDRWINITLSFEGTFYNGEQYERLQFNILNDWRLERHTKHLVIEINKFWLEKIKHSNFFKLIDFEEYSRIRAPLAARYFELFTKNFQGRDEWLINSDKLRIKIPYSDPRPSCLAIKSAKAINHLIDVTTMRVSMNVEFKQRGSALFRFKLLPRKAFGTGPQYASPQSELSETHANPPDSSAAEGEEQMSVTCVTPEFVDSPEASQHKLTDLFLKAVSQFPEFRVDADRDSEWFRTRIDNNPAYQDLDLEEEILNWADWLESQHRLKDAKKSNKFPKSNFRGSFTNWLKKSLEIRSERQPASKTETSSKGTPIFRKEDWEPYLPWIANPPEEWFEDEKT